MTWKAQCPINQVFAESQIMDISSLFHTRGTTDSTHMRAWSVAYDFIRSWIWLCLITSLIVITIKAL